MRITTLPVYSKLANESDLPPDLRARLPRKPDGTPWQLSQHQLETYLALTQGDADVIFNTAMTGDGKSLAAYLRALQDGDHVIAMYPTNELIRDQANGIEYYQASWDSKVSTCEMFGARISELMELNDTHSRMEQIRKLLSQNAILLTNPDLFHLMMSFKYGHQAWEQKELPFEVPANFDYFIFDEFHVFGIPQIVSVVNVLNYLTVQYRHKPSERKRFLFLSATPHPLMLHLLRQSGMKMTEIRGVYLSASSTGYRQILQTCDLYIDHINREHSAETWVKEHLQDIIGFYQTYPESKGAIILNSVAAARRLRIWLESNLPTEISVSENTGLTKPEARRESFMKRLLVGTSTVDIGVDFRINLLIFETTDAGSFIQRFGRLGRHAGFGAYRAYALLPKFIEERLAQKLLDGSSIERDQFNETVRDAFPTQQEFAQYKAHWGIWQAAHLLARAEQALPKGHPFVDDLTKQLDRTFDRPARKSLGSLVRPYWAKSKDENEHLLLDELTSFRGQNPLSCGLWDLTDDAFKTYDLLFLLANARFEVIEADIFMTEALKRGLAEYAFRYQLLYAKIYEYTPERENFVLSLDVDLIQHEEWLHRAQAIKGFTIKESAQPWLGAVNRALKKVHLVCTLSDMPPDEIKRRLTLPPMFPIYRLRDEYDSEYSIAFGQNALLLDSLLFCRKTAQDSAIIA